MIHSDPLLRRALGVALVLLIAGAIYMSWGALYEFAIACGLPVDRAIVFPAIIDVVTIVAMLIGLRNDSAGRWEKFYPWGALLVFGAFTILGNAMHVVSTPRGEIKVTLWVAVLANAMPAIALLVVTHLAAVTVYRKRAPAVPLTVVPAPARTRELLRPRVMEMAEQGRSVRDIERETGVPRSTVDRWINRAGVTI